MAFATRARRHVRYRTAQNKVKHATIVSKAGTLTLRVGNGPNKLTVTGVSLTAVSHHGSGAGWYR